jgi:fumarate reductase iron-sulfur subunit
MDPRDSRDDVDWFEVVSNSDGVFGCLGLMACHDVCPKELPLLDVYAYLRRKSLGAAYVADDD